MNTGAADSIDKGNSKSQARMSIAYATDGHRNSKSSGAHGWPPKWGSRPRTRTVKWTLMVRTAAMLMNMSDDRLSGFACAGAHR